MKVVAAAVRALALAVLLGGARAAAGGTGVGCQWRERPKLTINSNGIIRIVTVFGEEYSQSYGKSLILYCSFNNTLNLTIYENDESLQTKQLNTTTIQLLVRSPNIGLYEYTCVDNGTGCDDYLFVEVYPAISVESRRVDHGLDTYTNIMHYFVPFGEDYVVLCSGHDAKLLRIQDVNDVQLQTTMVNSTTIQHKAPQTNREEDLIYYCKTTSVLGLGDSVTVNYYPESFNFRCVVYNFQILECIWTYASNQSKFNSKLFYTDHTAGSKTMTIWSDTSDDVTLTTCRVDETRTGRIKFYSRNNISLVLMTCNDFFCHNQTFAMNLDTIRKQHSVYKLRVIKTSTYGAVMEWTDYYCKSCVYKVESRLKEDRWRQEDASTVRCNLADYDNIICNFTLLLPYPDTEYEVRVSARHKDSTDERTWSDPRSILVRTEPSGQCACDAELEASAATTTISVERATCEACSLTGIVIKEALEVKGIIKNSLEGKRAHIEEYLEYLKQSEKLNEFAKKVHRTG